ncbi:hypothetical protein T484DRAFT_1853632 [Baffinella frigidus]|nr:hypothetical protein T484DRAFT_1853632 [Cryptophyta sp. CCMP2293]
MERPMRLALRMVQGRSGGLLSGAPRILSRPSAAPKIRMRLTKTGELEPAGRNFHGGFLEGSIFGKPLHILESRYRWRHAASSAISFFHAIPSESWGLDTPDMRAEVAELERGLAEEDDTASSSHHAGLRALEGCLFKGATSKILVAAGAHILRDFDADNKPPRTLQAKNMLDAAQARQPAPSYGAATSRQDATVAASRGRRASAPLIFHHARELLASSRPRRASLHLGPSPSPAPSRDALRPARSSATLSDTWRSLSHAESTRAQSTNTISGASGVKPYP